MYVDMFMANYNLILLYIHAAVLKCRLYVQMKNWTNLQFVSLFRVPLPNIFPDEGKRYILLRYYNTAFF